MKRLSYILILLILVSSCNQKSKNSSDNNQLENDKEILLDSIPIKSDYTIDCGDTIDREVFFSCEEMPKFGNGREDLKKYIQDNTEYPQTAIEDSVEGRVYIFFVINEDGSVSDSKVLRGIRYDLDNECIRVINNMPDWKPGKQRGKLVKITYIIPFTFSLELSSGKGYIISPKNKSFDFKIYPNPATDYVNIELSNFKDDVEFQMINTKGQLVKKGPLNYEIEQINISNFERGIYIVQLIYNEERLTKTQKLIKK